MLFRSTGLQQRILLELALREKSPSDIPISEILELDETLVRDDCRVLIDASVLIRGVDERLEFVDPLFANWVRSGRSSPAAAGGKTLSAVLGCLQK